MLKSGPAGMSDGIACSGFEPTLLTARWTLVQFSLLACYTVGIHGVTSFPYYVYKHSGVFLVAFYVLMVLICVPVCYVQIKLGALFKRGILGIFGILVPVLKGSAISILALTYIRCLLHGVELSYALYFGFSTLQWPLPWTGRENLTVSVLRYHSRHAEKYFHEDFLQITEHICEGGSIVWYIALCLLVTWLAIYILTFKGTALISKVAYILTPVTLLMLVVVMIYGYIAIPGAIDAVSKLLGSQGQYMDTTHSDNSLLNSVVGYKLSHPRPWIDALNLHISSIGLWSGLLPTLGTLVYNRKHIVNASWILLLLVYSVMPQLALFALAPYINPLDSGGFIAASKGIKPGLPFLFIAIPTTFERHQLSPFIGFCLFICIFLFGLHHQALHLIAIWDNVLPSTPKFLMSYFRRQEFLIASACGVSYLLSVPYAIQGGIHLYAVIHDYVDRLVFVLIIISTVPFLIGYIKQEVLYIPIERAFMSLWYGLSAIISSGLLIYYFSVYVYPEPVVGYEQRWAESLGWVIAIVPLVLGLTFGAFHAVIKQKGTILQKLVQSMRSESLNTAEVSNTSGGTGDTVLTGNGVHASEELDFEKTETEVFVQPIDDSFQPANV